ncbi:hypothetical protein ACHAW5_001282 [Stephanodiscus triporus]|uniref:Uncharacterized protein n=1 Tax=Stephanodiscus triporus TaxID=2934178 RepID=A0ABD3N1P9_9STRA
MLSNRSLHEQSLGIKAPALFGENQESFFNVCFSMGVEPPPRSPQEYANDQFLRLDQFPLIPQPSYHSDGIHSYKE